MVVFFVKHFASGMIQVFPDLEAMIPWSHGGKLRWSHAEKLMGFDRTITFAEVIRWVIVTDPAPPWQHGNCFEPVTFPWFLPFCYSRKSLAQFLREPSKIAACQKMCDFVRKE
jgi:hypothetical protein